MTINTYLTFDGNCEEAFNYYKAVLGGEFSYVGRFKEMPPSQDYKVPESDMEKIMHISLPISKETTLMGSDILSAFGQKLIQGNNFAISINIDELEDARNIFSTLSEGGKITMPFEKTFWQAYFGSFTDKFGINWMVNCNTEEHKNK